MDCLKNYSSVSAVHGPEICILPFSRKTQRNKGRWETCDIFEVSLWDRMNNSRVFIQHGITDLFLLSPLLSPSNLVPVSAFISPFSSTCSFHCLSIAPCSLSLLLIVLAMRDCRRSWEEDVSACLHWRQCTLWGGVTRRQVRPIGATWHFFSGLVKWNDKQFVTWETIWGQVVCH